MFRRSMTRSDFLRLSVAASGTALSGGALAACGGGGQLASGKPSSLNMLYATAEANSEALELVLPDFESDFGVSINMETNPYDILIVDPPWMPALTTKSDRPPGLRVHKAASERVVRRPGRPEAPSTPKNTREERGS